MQMKKFINDPNSLTDELLEGLALAHADTVDVQGTSSSAARWKRRTASPSSPSAAPAISPRSAASSARAWWTSRS